MSDVPSWEYKIMEKHLSSSRAPSSELAREQLITKGKYFTQKCARVITIDIYSSAPSMKQTWHNSPPCCPAQINPFYEVWHIIISMIPFLSPLSAQHRVEAGQWQWRPFHLWGFMGGGDCESQAEIMWPAERQTAAGENSRFHVHTGSKVSFLTMANP